MISKIGCRPPMTTAQKAYWAGLFDGEGYVGIYRKQNLNGNDFYHVSCSLTSTDLDVAPKMKALFGGSIHSRDNILKNGKPFCVWTVVGVDACFFLKQILPYLEIKFARACKALAFKDLQIGNCKLVGIDGASKRHTSSDMHYWNGIVNAARRAACYEMTKLNHRGLKPLKEEFACAENN